MLVHQWIQNNKKNTKSIQLTFLNKTVLKSLLRDKFFEKKERIYFGVLFNKYSASSSFSSFRRYCIVSESPRSIFRRFRLSRHLAKSYAAYGYLSGMRKSSF